MAKLTPESAWEFADAIKAIVKPQTTRRKATVQNIDKDGTIWVNLPGSSTVTPIQSTGANVSPGDTVLTELRGTSLHITENQTNPAIGENTARSIAKQETAHAEAMAKQAKTIADEAQAVAEATNQHFFADTNGAHITDVTQDEWTQAVEDEFSDYDPTTKPYHNMLLNSLGILLRTALNNLVSITRSAIAFYDGQGNAASNIVARFGSDGARIGKEYIQGATDNESHMELDYHSMQMIDRDGNTYLHVSDLRGANSTTTTITERFTGNGTRNAFLLSAIVDTVTSVTIDGHREGYAKHDQMFRFGNAQILLTRIDTSITPPDGSIVEIVYTSNEYPKVYTFGSRASGNVGMMSRTDGALNRASALFSSASGFGSSATGVLSHAEGASEASGILSHAQNNGTKASSYCQTAMGKYNVEDANDDYALIIGNGTSDNARSNAAAITWLGEYIAQGWAGVIQMFAGATPPAGWLLCDGSAVSRTTYATLFAAIGTTWGVGDGSTTFNLPDLRGRAPIGAGTGSGLTARTLGDVVGSEYLQAHTHAFTNPTITTHFTKQYGASGTARDLVRTGGTTTGNPSTATGGAVGAVTGVTTGNDGNMQPSAVVNFIIHTGKTS